MFLIWTLFCCNFRSDSSFDGLAAASRITPRDHVSHFITYGWGPGGRAMPIFIQNFEKCIKQNKDPNKCSKYVMSNVSQKRSRITVPSTSYLTSGLPFPSALASTGPMDSSDSYLQGSLSGINLPSTYDPLPSPSKSLEDLTSYLVAPESYDVDRYNR
uniref:Uncharacterized protein n=1 Tax=Tetranychus urticae TaxID=32264 RepID=T1KKA2_TETUR